jgi:hypothetical protein
MDFPGYLFDIKPFTRRPLPKAVSTLRPPLREALTRLKRTLDSIPAEEWETRRRRWRAYRRSGSLP